MSRKILNSAKALLIKDGKILALVADRKQKKWVLLQNAKNCSW